MVNPFAIGALAGVIPGLSATKKGKNFLFGQKGGFEQYPTQTPQQSQYQNQILELLQGATPDAFNYISQILGNDPEAFKDFEQPFINQFEQEIVPDIAERLGGKAGSHGSLSSSGLFRQTAQAGKDLETNLASLRSGLKNQALSQLQSFINPATQSAFGTAYRPETGGFLGSAGGPAIAALIKYLTGGAG